MIVKIWLQIASVVLIAVLPVMYLQFMTQQQGLDIIYSVSEGITESIDFDKYASLLKSEAKREPKKSLKNKKIFEDLIVSKRAIADFSRIKESLLLDFTTRTVQLILAVLFLSLLASVLLSRKIVKKFRVLLDENTSIVTKKEQVRALSSWQKIARSLVHEIKAPITPIKLIASDIELKYSDLSTEQFGQYLHESQQLVREQVASIENMIEVFTKFGKLPDVKRELHDPERFLADFVGVFAPSLDVAIDLNFQGPKKEIEFDAKLMRDLIFNLTKNAIEANPAKKIDIKISSSFDQENNNWIINVFNTGSMIPAKIVDHIFEPYISQKHSGSDNMGLGLAVSRKIAIDHGGDVQVVQNDDQGVCFEILIKCKL